jgi:hypothetical protein
VTPEPETVLAYLDADAVRMDELEKAIGRAADLLDEAEDVWLVLYDKTAEALKDEMREDGRKGDPAEHWVVTETRRAHRAEYTTWRRAERAVKRLDAQRRAKSDAISARQSELSAMRDGFRVPTPRDQVFRSVS